MRLFITLLVLLLASAVVLADGAAEALRPAAASQVDSTPGPAR